ncbi:MAG TPA: anti-sigma factor [Allosphingosinicella sp.]|jgi:anti-sigma-K factor RskA|uniref:anti-sigma factor n=1 Tax=Allosphingosinicella sp. TaxID=2823234 RepID=UPI002F28DCFB
MTEPDDDVLAAEYVLGLLEGSERSTAEARATADPAFAEQVEAWSVRLAPMLTGSPVEPPAAVWHAIAAKLAANDDEGTDRTSAAIRRWRMATIGASAVAASLALVLVTRPGPAPQAPPVAIAPPQQAQAVLVASLGDEKSASAVTIAVEGTGERLLVTPVRLAAGGRAAELWIIPGDGTPRSLGVIGAELPSRVGVPESHRAHIHSGATFAISLEPAGGSPTGAPTGPIAASGKINRV